MYEKLLVPLDGSALAEVALPYAEELAGRLGSEVRVVGVIESSRAPYRHMQEAYLDRMVEDIKRGAKRYTDKAVEVKSVILVGSPAEKIVDYAVKEGICLTVMTTHGQTGIKQWPLGSVADKLVRALRCPVVIIRAGDVRPDIRKKGILNKILLPLDGSKESEAVVPFVEELAAKFGAEVVLFQVVSPGYYNCTGEGACFMAYDQKQINADKASAKTYLDKVAAQMKQKGVTAISEETKLREVSISTEVTEGDTAQEIINFAKKIDADLVAMSTHGRSGIIRATFGSVAERMLREGTTPLLLVKE